MPNMKLLSTLNARAEALCLQAETLAGELDIAVKHYPNGSKVLDFGHDRLGTNGAGVLLAKICMADLADVKVTKSEVLADRALNAVEVATEHPLEACIAAQYAGWPFTTESYFAMCSGPARIVRGEEPILLEYSLLHQSEQLVAVFESNKLPEEDELVSFAEDCGRPVDAESNVSICVATTSSLPGTIQIVSRSVETAMHKLHELEFDLRCVTRATGTAPIPPFVDDEYKAMGWTNDAILYGAEVTLWIKGYDGDIAQLVQKVPSRSAADFGESFLTIFERYNRDFYAVDRLLFSPAKVTLIDAESGESFAAGEIRPDILTRTFAL